MNKKSILLIAVSLLLGFIIGFLTFNITTTDSKPTITGQAIAQLNKHTYTTAICNNENKCIDVLIECANGRVISITPTSELINLGENFRDFRPEKEEFCI